MTTVRALATSMIGLDRCLAGLYHRPMRWALLLWLLGGSGCVRYLTMSPGPAAEAGSTDRGIDGSRGDGSRDADAHPPDRSLVVPEGGACTGKGCVWTLGGSGVAGAANGPAGQATFSSPHGVYWDGARVVVADTGNHLIRSIAGGQVTTLAGSGAQGLVEGPLLGAAFFKPFGVTGAGSTIYVADSNNYVVRRLAGGLCSTFAGTGDGKGGMVDGPAASARFMSIESIAVGPSGEVYVADPYNDRIRKIDSGQVSTVAGAAGAGFLDGPLATARFSLPNGVAVGPAGEVYVADQGNHAIRVIASGTVTTVAGDGPGFVDGPTASARFNTPNRVLVDSSGRVLVADTGNHRIRAISGGVVSTLAGDGVQGFRDGPAASAQFDGPQGLAEDGSGLIYIADPGNHRIRVLNP